MVVASDYTHPDQLNYVHNYTCIGIMTVNEKIVMCMKVDNSLARTDTVWREIPMKFLFILNDPPYGTERSYNGFRHVNTLSKRDDVEVKVFLMADAVLCAKKGQKTVDGYYNLEKMILVSSRRGVELVDRLDVMGR
jgi:hypothetical protein